MASDTTNGFVEQQVQEASSRNFSSPEAEIAVIGGILRKPAQNKGTLAQLHDDDFTDDYTETGDDDFADDHTEAGDYDFADDHTKTGDYDFADDHTEAGLDSSGNHRGAP